jgi:O-acetylhomoserine/O-acetylserine sulfhydrylase-like pyridoxal-dependent enzyme
MAGYIPGPHLPFVYLLLFISQDVPAVQRWIISRCTLHVSRSHLRMPGTFKKYDIDVIFVATINPEDFELVINEKTKALYVETIANSDGTLADITAMADVGCFDFLKAMFENSTVVQLAHKYGIPLIVDNTFAMGGPSPN